MHEKLIKRLRELASIPEHCENVADCGQCSKEDICLSFTNKQIIEVAMQAANVIEKLNYRETPMKITEIHVDEYYCPACGAENNCDQGYVYDAYCPACGQRLLQLLEEEI